MARVERAGQTEIVCTTTGECLTLSPSLVALFVYRRQVPEVLLLCGCKAQQGV